MLNLLELSIEAMTGLMLIICGLIFAFGALVIILITYHTAKQTKKRLSRINDIDYTEILNSVVGVSGSTYTYGSDGQSHTTYSSAPKTKFLVVYFSGEREIVTVNDNSELCKEYLQKLKKDV